MQKLTDGKGVDLVVDSVGGKTLGKSIQAAGYRGRIVSVGGAGRDDSLPDIRLLAPMNKSLTGVFFGAELAADNERVQEMVAGYIKDTIKGKLQIPIARNFPLSEATTAHAYIESREAVGRVVLVP